MCAFILIASNCWGQKKNEFCNIAFSENGLLLRHIYGYVLIICLPYEVHQFFMFYWTGIFLLIHVRVQLLHCLSGVYIVIINSAFLCIGKLNVTFCISNFSTKKLWLILNCIVIEFVSFSKIGMHSYLGFQHLCYIQYTARLSVVIISKAAGL